MNKKKPSTAFLVILNGLLFYSLGAIHCNIIGILITMPIATAMFMVISGLWQAIVATVIERRWTLKPAVRTAAFILPILVFIALPSLGIKPEQRINQQHPTMSPSGKHKAIVYTEDGSWGLKIDSPGTDHDLDIRTGFVSHLMIYWIWDKDDNFWVYNSDDGSVYVWILKEKWESIYWGYSREKETDEDLYPPADLFPDYAKNRYPTTKPAYTTKQPSPQQTPTLEPLKKTSR